MKFLRSESYKKGILQSIGFNVVAKGLSFVNGIAIAFFFGAQAKTDIYFYCFATVSLLVGYISSLDNSVIIPESMRIREQENSEKAMQFLNSFLYLYTGIGLLVVMALMIAPAAILNLISSFDSTQLVENKSLISWFMPICLLMLVTTFLTNVLSSYRFFTIPILAGVVNNLFSLLFLFFFHQKLQVNSLVLGLGTGYLVNIALLLFLLKTRLQWRFSFHWIPLDKRLKTNIRFALLGNVTSVLSGYVPYYIMSQFSPGAVTIFNYAKNLSEMPNQMITTQFSAVSGIRFNELSAKGETEELNRLYIQSTSFLLFVLTPVCGLLFLFPNEIVSLLYRRGAFGEEAVAQTAHMLRYLGFSLLYLAMDTMVSRLFMASQKLKSAFWYQVYMNVFFVLIVVVASRRFGIDGFIGGTLLYRFLTIVLNYWLMKRYFAYIRYGQLLKALGQNLLLNGSIVLLFSLLVHQSIEYFLLTAFYGATYLLIVVVANQQFGIDPVVRLYCRRLRNKVQAIASFAFPGARL